MGRIAQSLLLFLAIFLILLGVVFLIAGSIAYVTTGLMLVVIAVIILFFSYRTQKLDANRPMVVNQNIKIKMDAGGKMEERQLKCKSCGAALTDKDLKLVEGGIVATCPYCGTVTNFEEAPKW
jgi:Na+/melibiose symporter-like transporter